MSHQIPKKLTPEQIKKLQKMFKKNGVLFAYQFGSVTDKKIPKTQLSDYDFALYFDENKKDDSVFGRQVQMMTKISEILNFPQVDVVDLNTADPIIKHQAIFNGQNIYSTNDQQRIALEHKAVQDYEDIKPLNNLANKTLKEFVLTGEIGRPMIYQKAD